MRHRIYNSSHKNKKKQRPGINNQIIQFLNLAVFIFIAHTHTDPVHFAKIEIPFELGRVVLSSPQLSVLQSSTSNNSHRKEMAFQTKIKRDLQTHTTSLSTLSTKTTTIKVIPSSRAESASDFSSELSSGFISSWVLMVLVERSAGQQTAHCLNAAMRPANLRVFWSGHAEALGRWDNIGIKTLQSRKNSTAMRTMY